MKRIVSILLSVTFLSTIAFAQNLKEGFSFDRKGQILTVKHPDGHFQHIDLNNPAFKGKAIAFTYSAKKKTVYHEPEKVSGSVQVFPNPAYGSVNVLLDRSWDFPVQMQVCDKNGHTIKTQSLETENTSMNIDAFPQGIYIIKFQAGSTSATHKLVVQ
ncbi:T9SS type A sorting domain-containing protein [Dyadobacter jiangsuensis]|uniref:Putative secreted protein (Por secretion system target) n=1 Tax=Dyadobacter jiangsuensis TaxID=1591085 RepID=A0A2P8FY28_9BACT|nr:T9SS type A sorting domain-containing protein [Dyadobacter jiangsuensis]PSL26555.1 putative secreted protein (Por secretion system target) [Dyadobacter jiangsuensis]